MKPSVIGHLFFNDDACSSSLHCRACDHIQPVTSSYKSNQAKVLSHFTYLLNFFRTKTKSSSHKFGKTFDHSLNFNLWRHNTFITKNYNLLIYKKISNNFIRYQEYARAVFKGSKNESVIIITPIRRELHKRTKTVETVIALSKFKKNIAQLNPTGGSR